MKIDLERFGAAKDIKSELIAATAKAVEGTRLLRNRVLVASFVASERTAGGIIRPQRTMDEDRFQGKVGLLLKMGPIAFQFPEDPEGEFSPELHQWVLYHPGDSREVGLGEGAPCRVIFDDLIQAIVENPMDYY